LIEWAKAVQGYVEKESGFYLVRGLGGHGIGRSLHESPYISNTAPTYPGEWNEAWKTFEPGMLLAVEPMISLGTNEVRSNGSAWPIYTADGSLSVHYEADVMVTANGCEDLTAGMSDLPDVVGCKN
jgi:methionyl aminopeptidase